MVPGTASMLKNIYTWCYVGWKRCYYRYRELIIEESISGVFRTVDADVGCNGARDRVDAQKYLYTVFCRLKTVVYDRYRELIIE